MRLSNRAGIYPGEEFDERKVDWHKDRNHWMIPPWFCGSWNRINIRVNGKRIARPRGCNWGSQLIPGGTIWHGSAVPHLEKVNRDGHTWNIIEWVLEPKEQGPDQVRLELVTTVSITCRQTGVVLAFFRQKENRIYKPMPPSILGFGRMTCTVEAVVTDVSGRKVGPRQLTATFEDSRTTQSHPVLPHRWPDLGADFTDFSLLLPSLVTGRGINPSDLGTKKSPGSRFS